MLVQKNSQMMASPHPEWDDCEGGLRNEEAQIVVSPVDARFSDYGTVVRSASAGNGNAYSVGVYVGSPAHRTRNDIAVFQNARLAWEFAHLLTHYFTHRIDPETAKNDLIRSKRETSTDDLRIPNHAVEELSASEVFEKLLSSDSTPDAMSDMLE